MISSLFSPHHIAKTFFTGFLLLILALAGCAPRVAVPPDTGALPQDEILTVWSRFDAYSDAREADQAPYRLRGSLRYGQKGTTRRVSLLLWSNGTLPVRLDVLAGINSIAARLLEDTDTFVAYAPGEKKALVHNGAERIYLNFGRPVPFSLRDFSALMRGRFHEVFGFRTDKPPFRTAEGTLRFTIYDGSAENELDIASTGLPVRWSQPGGWIMHIEYTDAMSPLPRKIKLEHPDGYTAILLVKERDLVPMPFTVQQLALDLPDGTTVEPVKKLKEDR